MDPCATINTYVIKPIKPHIDRALRERRYGEALENKVEDLERKHQRLKDLVADARRETRVIDQQVHLWATKVERRIAEDRLILDEYERLAQQRCFIGLCPNFRTRYQLNYKAEAEVTAVEELLGEAAGYDAPDNISRLPPAIAETPPIAFGDYESFQSREIIAQQVVDALTVSGKSKIGVYGMGGSGKTTLVKVVAGKVMEKKSFDFVVLCKVTAVPNIANIQKEIMEKLGLKVTEETPDARATRLLEGIEKMLEEKKKILFVLDDLWKKLKLEAVGIPSPDQHKGCQILMTSRQRQVLSTEMGCDNNAIHIGLLSEDEAWELFKKMSGNNFEKNDALQSKAHEVAKACARLPIAIVTVARALKNKTNLSDWEAALLDLQGPSVSNFSGVQEDDPETREHVHNSIYLSYKLLASVELRSTLLLCSQLPNNSSIRDLLRYSWSLRLLPEKWMRKVEDAQNMLRSLVGQLQDSCLLLDTGSKERISLHDVVRLITQAIASKENHVFITSPEDDELTDLPDDQNLTRMWLRCKVAKLPEKLEYGQLQLFHMQNVNRDLEVGEGIFKLEGGQRLKVLSLTNFSFPCSLPFSLRSLKRNLGTLCLDGSSLEGATIAIIGQLQNLEILSFAKCKIRRLPEEIGKLKKLKILDLSDCPELKEVPCDVISRLSVLEELYMGNSFSGWGKEGGAQASLAEVKMLSHLSNLEIVIPDAGVMVENLFSKGLKRYRVTIGTDEWWDESYETLSKFLRISLSTCIDFGLYGIQMLLSSAEVLCLRRMKDAKNMLSEGFPRLKHLKLEENFETQYVVDAEKSDPSKAFPALESIFLGNLDSLEEICHGEFRSQPFPSLTAIEVGSCRNLKNLFSFSIAQGLSQLKSIVVRNCASLEGIIDEEDEATDNKIEFSELRSMILDDLPRLKKCCYKMQETPNSSGKTLLKQSSGWRLSKQSSLFDEKIVFAKLEELELESINMKTLWHGPLEAVKSSFQNLRRLSVDSCGTLKYLFTSSMVGCLVKLEYLSVKWCDDMEEIILTEEASTGEEGRINENVIMFSKLDALYLWRLPKLQQFCSGCLIKCPLLKKIDLYECPALKTFVFSPSSCESKAVNAEQERDEEDSEEKHQTNARPLFDEKVYFPSLAELETKSMENLEKIWHEQLWDGSFCTLRSMAIIDCEQLLNVFPSKISRRFMKLEQLRIERCHALEEIFDLQWSNVDERIDMVDFQLRDINLDGLYNLRHIWKQDRLPEKLSNFGNLQSVTASKCPLLKSIFPASIARNLMQLETLDINNCARVEEIVAMEEGIGNNLCFRFPNLSSLSLWKLPKLENLYPGMHTSEWPVLKELVVVECHAVKFLFQKFPILIQLDAAGQPEIQIQQPLLYRSGDIQLQKGEVVISATKGHEVWYCDSLFSLASPFAGFQSLTTLKVYSYNGLTYIMPPSTAKSLVQLKELSVCDCSGVSEIVSKQDGRTKNDEITFSKLESLMLVGLKSLANFSSGGYAFIFPNLKKVIVERCPAMRFFSSGHSLTPKLEGVQWEKYDENKVEWKGDLNSTIQHLFKEMVAFDRIWHLKLSDFPEMREIWHGQLKAELFKNLSSLMVDECQFFSMAVPSKLLPVLNRLEELDVRNCSSLKGIFDLQNLNNDEGDDKKLLFQLRELSLTDLPRLSCISNKDPQRTLEFKRLRFLKIDMCSSLKNIFTPSMAMGLNALEEMEIRNCSAMQEIISATETGEEAPVAKMTLPALKNIILESLPNLIGIYGGSGILEFPSLEGITIANCHKMNEFLSSMLWEQEATNYSEEKGKGVLDIPVKDSLLSSKVHLQIVFPKLQELELDSINMKTLWHGPLEAVESSFQNLRRLSVENRFELKYLFTSSMVGCLVQLEYLSVKCCNKMEEIILTEEVFIEEEGRIDEKVIVFAKLDALYLWGLPKLKRFCTASLIKCPHLKKITLRECHALKTFVFHSSCENKSVDAVDDEDLEEKQHEKNQPLFDEKVSVPNLAEMEIERLDNLEKIWNKDPEGILSNSFPNLQSVTISGCPVLKNIFPSSIAEGLMQLEELKIKDCAAVEEIIAQDKNFQDIPCFKFYKLSSLTLKKLPKLKNFYPARYTLEWPELQELDVTSSVAEKLLVTMILGQVHGDGHLKNQSQQPVLWGKRDIKMVKDQVGPREKLPFSSNKPTSNIETAKGGDDLPIGASQEEALKDSCASENTGFNTDLHQEIDAISEVIIEEQAGKNTLKTPETAQYVSTDIFSSAILDDKGPTPGQISSTPENQEPNGSVLVQKDPLGTADNEPPKHQAIASPVSARSAAEQAPMSILEHPSKTTSFREPTCSQVVGASHHSIDVQFPTNGQEGTRDNLATSSRQLTLRLDASQEKAVPQDKLPLSSTQPNPNLETAKAEKITPLSAFEEPASEDLCATENSGSNKDLHQEMETTAHVIIEEGARKDTSKTTETAQYVSVGIFTSSVLNDKDPTPGQSSSTPESLETHSFLLADYDPQATSDNEHRKHKDNFRDNFPLARQNKEMQEATPSDTQYRPSPLSHQSLLRDNTEIQELLETKGEGVHHTHSIDSPAVDAPLPSVVFPANAEVSKTGQTVSSATSKTLSKQPISNFDASQCQAGPQTTFTTSVKWPTSNFDTCQEGLTTPTNMGTDIPPETQKSPHSTANIETLEHHDMPESSNEQKGTALESFVAAAEQAPAMKFAPGRKTESSQELTSVKTVTLSVSSDAADVRASTSTSKTTSSEDFKSVSSTEAPSKKVAVTKGYRDFTMSFDNLPAIMEHMLNSIRTSYSQLRSTSSTHAESSELPDSFSDSISLVKQILRKNLAEVARSADSHFLLHALKNLRKSPLLNPHHSELIQVCLENFDSIVMLHQFYEHQIHRANALKFSIEDEEKEIAEIKTHNEDLNNKTNCLSVEKEALMKRLGEIEEEEDHIRASKERVCGELVRKRGILQMHKEALPEALMQQREAEEKASEVNGLWAKIGSSFD